MGEFPIPASSVSPQHRTVEGQAAQTARERQVILTETVPSDEPGAIISEPGTGARPVEEPVVEGEASPESTGSEEEAPLVGPYVYVSVIRTTRSWIQYGVCGFVVLCIVIGAVEALLGR